MSAREIIVQPGGAAAGDEPEVDVTAYSIVTDAIDAAYGLVPGVELARARRDALAIELATASQSTRSALPPIVAAIMSITTVAIIFLLSRGWSGWHDAVGIIGGAAIAANIGALGSAAVLSFRLAADRSCGRLSRLAWAVGCFATVAALAASGIDQILSGRAGIAAAIAVLASAGAAPWLFARMRTAETTRLASELDAATADLSVAEDNVGRALDTARRVFDDEIAAIRTAAGRSSTTERGDRRTGAVAGDHGALWLAPRPGFGSRERRGGVPADRQMKDVRYG